MRQCEGKYKKIYLLYTSLFIGIWGLWLLPFFLRGNGTIALGDGFNQYYPAFVYIRDYLRKILTFMLDGGIKQFDFRIGLGDDALVTLNYYGLGDILNSLSMLVPVRYTELAFTVIMLLRYYLCGIAFLVYSRRYVRNPFLRVAGGLMYTGCVFGLLFGLRFAMFLSPMITIPLILRGVDDILINQSRLSKWFIFGLFLQSLNGFYFLYMQIIIVAIYFVIMAIAGKRGKFFSRSLSLMIQGALGISLGGYLLLPAIIGVFNSNRLADGFIFRSFFDLFFYNNKQYYLSKISHLLVPNAYEASITIPVPMLAGAIFLFFQNKKYKEFTWLFGITGVLFLLPIMGSVMNGFSIPTDRWYFMVLLLEITGTILMMQDEVLFSRKNTFFFRLIGVLLIIINIITDELSIGVLLRSVLYLFMIFLLPHLWNLKRHREMWLLAYVSVTVAMSGLFLFGPRILGGSGFSAEFKTYGSALAEIEDSVSGLEKEEKIFSRWDIYSSSRGSSLVMDYFGTTEYFSIINAHVIEFYQNLAVSPGIPGGSFDTIGLDGRIELESLLSVSNYMDFATEEDSLVPVIVPNNTALPLGFTYDSWISRKDFDRLNPMEKMSRMMDSAVLEEAVSAAGMNNNYAISMNIPLNFKLEYLNIKKENDRLYTNHESRIRVWLTDFPRYEDFTDRKGELYIKLGDFALYSTEWKDFLVGNKTLQLRNELVDSYNYEVQPDEYWVNVTEIHKSEDNFGNFYFDIYSLGENCYSLRDVGLFFHPLNRQAINERAENKLNKLEIENNRISGVINTEKTELLFLSIPFSKGWSATVDGIKAKVYQTNIAFISVLLEPGEHEVCFTYSTPGFKTGTILSVISLLILITWLCREKIIMKTAREKKDG